MITPGEATQKTTGTPALARAAVAAALLLASLMLLPGLGDTPLVDWDEGIYAEVARGVHEGSAWRLEWNGEAYDRKPPLLFWAIAASYDVLGVGEGAARLPSALAGVASIGLVAAIVAGRSGPLPALLSAACLLGSTLFLERGGRRASTDSFLILFTLLALWRATENAGTRRGRIEAGLAVGLAILAKGAAGLIAPLALLLAAGRRRERLHDVAALLGVATLVAGPWYAAQLLRGGTSFLASHVGYEVIARAVRPIHGDGAPWWYPLEVVWQTSGSWVAIVVVGVLVRAAGERAVRDAVLPWACAAAVVLGAAMAMQTKLPWYALPALPMIAVAGGIATAGGAAPAAPWLRRTALALLAVAALDASMLTPGARRAVVDDELQFTPFRELGGTIASALGEEPFIGATRPNPTLVFYGRRPIRVYEEAELARLLRDPDALPRAGLVPEADAAELLVGGAEEIARFGDRVLVRSGPGASQVAEPDASPVDQSGI